MKFYNFSGKSKIGRGSPVTLGDDATFSVGRTTYFVDRNARALGNSQRQCFRTKDRKGGGLIRTFSNGTITFIGMRSAEHATKAVRALRSALNPASRGPGPKVEITRSTGSQSLGRRIDRVRLRSLLAQQRDDDDDDAQNVAYHLDPARHAALRFRHGDNTVFVYGSGKVTVSGPSQDGAKQCFGYIEAECAVL